MEFFKTLVDAWKPQTNNTTKTFILDIGMVLDIVLEFKMVELFFFLCGGGGGGGGGRVRGA